MRKEYVFNEDSKGFSDKLKELMKTKGWTIESLSSDFNYGVDTIKKWRTGQRMPNLDTLQLLANIFHVTVQELYLPNSIYDNNLSEELKALIAGKETNAINDIQLQKEILNYTNYLFQKKLYSFLKPNEQKSIKVLFRYFRVTDYAIKKLVLSDTQYDSFFKEVEKYIDVKYGSTFPYTNDANSRKELLKEFDKWVEPIFGGQ